MAIYKIFPTKDTSLYSVSQSMNTGLDEIIEASTYIQDSLPQVSRYLIKFPTSQISEMYENKITNGDSNVIVTDGFTGNIALKTAEGTAKFITDSLKESLTETLLAKFSILFSYFALKKFKTKLDPRKFNGAIFLGLKGPVVKSHGSTDAIGFYHSIDLCYRIIKGDLMNKIKNNLSHGSSDRL